ncbi:MAG: DUF4920 domain-containing protein [Bacteroidetes bacterium]|nr:DUF4920 domain-containing protein [Bacteroidota bacterium]
MKRIILVLMVGLAVGISCQPKSIFFGEEFKAESAISVDDLYGILAEVDSVENVVVEGTIEDVCQVKGCWMTLVASNGDAMRVSFYDYGFFVPKDGSGKKVMMKGAGRVEVTSVSDLQHYAQDAGDSEEEIAAITEPLREFTFVADGVQLLN